MAAKDFDTTAGNNTSFISGGDAIGTFDDAVRTLIADIRSGVALVAETEAALKAWTIKGGYAWVLGDSTLQDRQPRLYVWDGSDTTADDGNLVLIPDDITHPASGRWLLATSADGYINGDLSVVGDAAADGSISANSTSNTDRTVTAYNDTGGFQLLVDTSGNMFLKETGSSGTAVGTVLRSAKSSSNAELYFSGNLKVETLVDGAQVTGRITSTTFIDGATTAGIVAGTTQTQAGGTDLTTTVNEIATVGTTNDAITMPAASAGRIVYVINNGGNTMQLFPASGDNFSGSAADAAITLATTVNGHYVSYNGTTWESF